VQYLADAVMKSYPRIFFACHTRHVRDDQAGRTISAHQASVLDHLDELEGTSLATLAAHMGVTLSTMSLTVDRLERGGYVTRQRDTQDGRRISLRLTADGARLRSQKTVLDADRVLEMIGQLSTKEREQAIHGLGLLARAAGQMMQQKSTRRKAGLTA
jgi:MarR family transcriptional regulator, organic hydroperoxide resistance regulator